ncbi:TIGR02147 family protein [Bacteriovoracaceae bacterium]|nr:TIGR02147 family protein [Bacteriovoracaceae bacterium]
METVTSAINKSGIEIKKIEIFSFTDYSDFLNAYVNEYGRYSHGPFNLKNWAKRLGYKSPSSLAMVLNKQRFPTWKMIAAFSEDFKLNKNERRYFELLVELERKKLKGEPLEEIIKEAKRISGLHEYQQINFNQFTVVSDWYCYAIKRLVALKDFQNNEDWIFKKLRRKVSKAKIRNAIDSLIGVGLVKQTADGGLADSNPKTHTGNEVPSAAIRSHHRGMIERSLEALEEQSIENRIFQAMTLSMDKSTDKEKAFDDIKNFINDFNRKYSKDNNGDSVYQLNVQLFEHSVEIDESQNEH